jgi:hypothetical protein
MLAFLFAVLLNTSSVSGADKLIDRNAHLSRCRTTILRRNLYDSGKRPGVGRAGWRTRGKRPLQ